ncbi:flagellar M-ring protein FliF C-terminal domain-containing protein, partial [Sandarakinorhabdus rubra]|uniref:flagellar M-ring protein FliF C-terminal domain-containing protein n=1 Tax=Sandarakinorhabdus rubra TaxID=2672568 RepID=UPI002E2C3598
EAGAAPAQGIPGALTNTAPPAAQLSATPPALPPAAAASPPQVTQESASRMWEIGKDVSVTRAAAPRLKRLSVALLVDAGALGKGGARDLTAIRRLVQGAMGYDAARGDLIEVQTRAFAGNAPTSEAWYDAPAVRNWGPVVAGVLLLALGGLGWFLWQRRSRLAAARELAANPPPPRVFGDLVVPAGAPIDGGDLRPATARDYSGKLDKARTLVTGDRDRAMAVARQMLLTSTVASPSAIAPQNQPGEAA